MAKFEFKLPDIGEGVTEGEIVTWLVKEGDTVVEDQDMVEVMTDKATVTIGAPKAGLVAELRGKEGQTVPVGDVLVVIELDAGASGKAAKPSTPVAPPPAPAKAPAPAGNGRPSDGGKKDDGPAATAVGDIRESLPGMNVARAARPPVAAPAAGVEYYADKPLAAPATRKLARELGVDLRRVPPTGDAGRVTRQDVEGFAAGGLVAAPAPAQPAPDAEPARGDKAPERAPARAPAQPASRGNADERTPIRGIRKRIYENMARSKHTAAHFTYVDECDTSALRELRDRTKSIAQAEGLKLSFLPFIVKAVVAALKKHPALNCLVDDAAQELVLKREYDIGIAAATDAGLTVPVLRGADRRSILDIAREIERLGQSARDGKLRMEDLGGSSFTITSLGKLGGLFATPIVNYPEVAILGVHEMKKRPVVRDDQIVIGEVMLLSLSFDHRIIDGHVGAAFARTIIELLEQPDRLLVSMS
ncbi:MAG: 2-oxo acid dehydrogenase subunit E2 [Polyangiaceae bacterium]|nr:2-oxo acid dehydrogenase subunit E2 [Polyangiaceae bacterium]